MTMAASNERSPTGGDGKAGLAGLGAAVLMIGCCGGAPLLIALAGTVGAAAVLGAAGAVVAVTIAVVGVVMVIRRRRRHACQGVSPGLAARESAETGIERVPTEV